MRYISILLCLLALPAVAQPDRKGVDTVRLGPTGVHVFVVARNCFRSTGQTLDDITELEADAGKHVYEMDRCVSIFKTADEVKAYLDALTDDTPPTGVLANGDPLPKPWEASRRAVKAHRIDVGTGTVISRDITYAAVPKTGDDHTFAVSP